MSISTGWIDRSGYFHPCDWHKHAEHAQKMGLSEKILEQRGWIKITRLSQSAELFWVMREIGRMTPEQCRKLHRMGFDDILEDDVTYG